MGRQSWQCLLNGGKALGHEERLLRRSPEEDWPRAGGARAVGAKDVNENYKKTSDWKMILGGILLIIILFMGVKLVFWFLGETIPQAHRDGAPSVSASQGVSDVSEQDGEAPSFCVHCGKALPERFQWGQFCPYCGEKVG